MNCLTEMYSAIEAEVDIGDDPSIKRNEALVKELMSFDKVSSIINAANGRYMNMHTNLENRNVCSCSYVAKLYHIVSHLQFEISLKTIQEKNCPMSFFFEMVSDMKYFTSLIQHRLEWLIFHYYLSAGTSPVAGFEREADAFIDEMIAKGVQVKTISEVI